MKVLLVTPYSPLVQHDHAANDIALPLVQALAQHMDLHVYAPGQQNGALPSWQADGVTFHFGSPIKRTQFNRLALYPYVSRGSWGSQSTREVGQILQRISPDVLHAEYDQAVEPLLRFHHCATTLTMHDLPGEVATTPRAEQSHLRYRLQQVERAKARRLTTLTMQEVDGLFVRSERDRAKIPQARGIVRIAPVGLTPPDNGWQGDRPLVVAFGGAMWRSENELTAIYIANEVMPLVRREIPGAELRIFGARPTAAVRALGNGAGVTIVGEVDDYDEEFRRAGVTIAPAMVDAGLLMKAIRAMAMGCPVVLNPASAEPIVGLQSGVHALVGLSAAEMANGVVLLMRDQLLARQLGEAAMNLVRPHFSWDRTVNVYVELFEQLLRHRRQAAIS